MADKEAQPQSTASGADRISALPDGIRELVLSFLPAHEAVRTTVLARSWRDLWMRSPALRITGLGSFDKFIHFVERLLRQRLSAPVSERHPDGGPRSAPAPLDYCHFDFGLYFDDEDHLIPGETVVNDWIQYVVRCQVQVLRFCFSRDCGDQLDLPDLSPVVTEHLTKLELVGVALGHNLNLSGCPALQELKMEGCYPYPDEIQAPYLKHLTVAHCVFIPMDRTVIRVPSLISLKLTECSGSTPLLASMPSLETAVVMINLYNCDDRCSLFSTDACDCQTCRGCRHYYGPKNGRTSCLLLNGLSEATSLELSAYPEVIVFIRDIKFASQFNKLKALVLVDWFVASDFSALIWFLHHSPVLEKLTLKLSKKEDANCQNSHLHPAILRLLKSSVMRLMR